MDGRSPYFVLTLPLVTEAWQEHILERRFAVNRQIYNALLTGGFKRYCQMTQTRRYRQLIAVLDQTADLDERRKLYRELDQLAASYRLSQTEFSRDSTKYRQHFPENTDAPVVQNLSARAWKAVYSLMCRRSKNLHLKKVGELNALEGKSNKTSIRYVDGTIVWKKLTFPVVRKYSTYEENVLKCEIRYCRLKRQWIQGKQRYFADLVLKGDCPVRNPIPLRDVGSVGIAVTLKRLYIVSSREIRVEEFPRNQEWFQARRGELIRKMEVSRRINNPQNYEENGRIRPGALKWKYSANYQKNRLRLKEIGRKQYVLRKEAWGKLIRSILEMGERFIVEQLDYRKLKETYFGKRYRLFLLSLL